MKPQSLNPIGSTHRDFEGLPLLNQDGDWLGCVSAFIRDADSGARFAVVTTARSSRSGSVKLLVPNAVMQEQGAQPGYVLTTDETLLDDAPVLSAASQIGERAYTRLIDAHYRA